MCQNRSGESSAGARRTRSGTNNKKKREEGRVSVRPRGQHLTLVKLDLPGSKVGDAKDSIRLRGRRARGYTSQLTRPRGL